LARSRRLRDIGEVDTIRALMESEEYLSQKKIAQMLGIHHETVKYILRNNLNTCMVNFK
jgi:Mn-dependent DtxR family transcriptional regulator